MIFYVSKSDNRLLTTNLKASELHCKCSNEDCAFTLVGESTIASFQNLRSTFGLGIRINSAYRCQRHNASVGGKPNSFHLRGMALDLTPADYSEKELDRLQLLAQKYYKVVIRYPTFIHCHNTE
jgi:hypothetical protein